ncbi:TRAP transporter substrate-binding protein [Salipiger bermudensis]|uniref:C4-dicarboxylate transport system C4-dicarboxylate-binding protein n=1 Tax=Salipiger bermudensis (strain DSM 26914 / JCM 13377 / KCTC 12554 / HTCC2601) TaxID=314265 RepID=Q0FSJ3_SALBH|nr:TRAP transporter substrate-binding protein [Salipiger bermudensis]EAU47260.1 C4-dicarboxylate transport system C4-dicarboxylate-binding protein [Salipiger bermudensis HTCC2601]
MKQTLLATALAALVLLPGAALAQQVVRIAYVTAENSPQASQARLFAEQVEARLPGAFEFRFFPSAQLGNEQATLEQLQLGTLEMGNLVTPMTEADDRLGIFDLPWLFEDRAHVQRAITGDLKSEIVGAAEAGTSTKVLGIYENGFRHVMSPVAITTPADMEGLKIRLPGGQVRQEVFRMLGANPTPIDWSEVYTALQTGVVDGAEAAAYGFAGSKLYQVSDHLSLTAHNYAPSFLVASQTFWSGLSDEAKTAFAEAAEVIIEPSFEEAATQDQIAIDEIATEAAVNEIDFIAFQAAVQPVYDDYIAENGSEWLDAIRAAQAE